MNRHDPEPEPPGVSHRLAHWLTRRAARHAPAELAARLEEEWSADLAACASPMGRVRFAIGCCWAARVIAGEHLAATVAAVTPAAGARFALSPPGFGSDFLPRHSLTAIAVVGFHIAIFYALLAGLGVDVTQRIPPSVQVYALPAP